MEKDDIVMAFFPCIRFEDQIVLWFCGNNYSQRNWSNKQKLEYDLKLHKELSEMYELLCKLFLICDEKGLKIILENPCGRHHYLNRYWSLKPAVIDNNRTERGDYLAKPTQFWFMGLEPKNNIIFEVTNNNALDIKDAINGLSKEDALNMGTENRKTARSMIHPDYANRFIREFIMEQ